MEGHHLSTKYLDAAIKTMERNRALLFAISLVAALILVIVYLDKKSFDVEQAERHLSFYQPRCARIHEQLKSIEGWNEDVMGGDSTFFKGCAELNKIRSFVVANVNDKSQLRELSENIYKLHIIQNEMNGVKLPLGHMAPLGIGFPVPRNDMFIICGALLVVLYTWLVFSFRQLANISEKISILFPDGRSEEPEGNRATVQDLVEINFLFDRSKGWKISVFVVLIFVMAPLSMTIAIISDYFLHLPEDTRDLLNVPLITQGGMTLLLWWESYLILRADKKVDKAQQSNSQEDGSKPDAPITVP
ncbi:MAG TPA: hypothetical protein VFS10_17205 [Pyrinomonadaceae bacterium]|nr:hypothetical protein [Pyrinomonadaceae bacterium]